MYKHNSYIIEQKTKINNISLKVFDDNEEILKKIHDQS